MSPSFHVNALPQNSPEIIFVPVNEHSTRIVRHPCITMVDPLSSIIGTIDVLVRTANDLVTRFRGVDVQLPDLLSAKSKLVAAKAEFHHIRQELGNQGPNLPPAVRDNIDRRLESVNLEVESVGPVLESLDNDFQRSGRHRFTRNNAITERIRTISDAADKAVGICLYLTTQLNILSSIPPLLSQAMQNTPGAGRSSFEGQFLVPELPRGAVLDFGTDIPPRTALSAEATLKARLLTLANGNVESVTSSLAVYGMGGVGKSVTLIGLAHDSEVRSHFLHGVYFLKLGQDASPLDLIRRLTDIVRLTGGRPEADGVMESETTENAVAKVAVWFRGKTALFVVDDLSSVQVPDGYVKSLRGLVQAGASSPSCLVLSTRDGNIAHLACTDPIPLEPHEPASDRARSIFLGCANEVATRLVFPPLTSSAHGNEIEKLLARCAGLPLTLSVVGSALSDEREGSDDWASALAVLEDTLESADVLLHDIGMDYPHSLEQALRTSLAVADDFDRSRGRRMRQRPAESQNRRPTATDFFIRLCVFQKQFLVSKGTLEHLWFELNPSDVGRLRSRLISLSLLSAENHEVMMVRAHDLIMLFCESEARRTGVFQQCHIAILKSYMTETTTGFDTDSTGRASSSATGAETATDASRTDTDAVRPEEPLYMIQQATRPWWEVHDLHGVIIDNLARWLVISGRVEELVGVLSHGKWTVLRMHCGGIRRLLDDFSACFPTLEGSPVATCRSSLNLIAMAISDMGYIIATNSERLRSDAFSRLFRHLDESLGLVARFIETSQNEEHRSWLRAMHPFMSDVRGNSLIEVPCEADGRNLAIDWASMRAQVLTSGCVQEVDLTSRTILRSHLIPYESALASSTDESLGNEKYFRAASLSRDGRLVAAFMQNNVLIYDQTEEAWVLQDLVDQWMGNAQFSPCGTMVAVFPYHRSLVASGRLTVFHLSSGNQSWDSAALHEDFINDIAFDAKSSWIASVSRDGWIAITAANSGRMLWNSPAEVEETDLAPLTSVGAGTHVIVAGGWDFKLRVWRQDAESDTFERTGTSDIGRILSKDDVVVSADDCKLAYHSDGMIVVVLIPTMQSTLKVYGTFPVVSLSISESCSDIAILEGRGMIKIWDIPETQPQDETQYQRHQGPVHALAVSSDAKRLVSANSRESVLESDVRNILSHEVLFDLTETGPPATMLPSFLVLSPDAETVGMAWNYSRVEWFPLLNREHRVTCQTDDRMVGSKSRKWTALAICNNAIRTAALQRNGMLFRWNEDGEIVYWSQSDAQLGRVKATLLLSSDGRRAVTSAQSCVELWEEEVRQPTFTLTAESEVTSTAISADGAFFVVGMKWAGIQVRAWCSPESIVASVAGHSPMYAVSAVAFGADGRTIVTCNTSNIDNCVEVWSMESDRLEKTAAASLTEAGISVVHKYVRDDSNDLICVGTEGGNVLVMEVEMR